MANIRGVQGMLRNLVADIRETIGGKGRYYRWGIRDNFPNVLIETVNDSGTARICTDKLQKFIRGDGFADEALKSKKANRKQTWGEWLKEASGKLAYFPGLAVQVKYNQVGDPVAYYLLELQHVRKREDGMFIYGTGLGDPAGYHYMYTSSKEMIIPPYGYCKTPEDRRELQEKQAKKYGEAFGEILYVYEAGVGLNYQHYPVPIYASGLNDIKADAGLSVHEESQVSNSFKGGVIINTRKLGRTEDEDGTSEYEKVLNSIENFTSPDGSPVLLLEGLDNELASSIQPLNIQHQMDATENATDRVGRKVCRLFGVPPILCGFSTEGKLGDNQEILNNLKLFNLTLSDKDDLLDEVFKILLPQEYAQGSTTRNKLSIIDNLPDSVIQHLTRPELEQIYDIPETDEQVAEGSVNSPTAKPKAPENQILTDMTGRQSQQFRRILRQYTKGDISKTEAKIFLQDGFGLGDEQIDTLLTEIDEGQ